MAFIELKSRLKILLDICSGCHEFIESDISSGYSVVFDKLATRLLVETHSRHIQIVFPDVITDLLNRCRLSGSTEAIGVALSHLNGTEVLSWAENFFSEPDTPSLLERFSSYGEPAKKRPKVSSSLSNATVLRSAYRFLCADHRLYGALWDWSCLADFLFNEESDSDADLLKWIACHCSALISQMTPAALDILLRQHLSEELIATLRHDDFLKEVACESFVDVVVASSNLLPQDQRCNTICVEGVTLIVKKPEDRCSNLRPLAGVGYSGGSRSVACSPTFVAALREVALSVSASKPVLILGEVGVGKSLLVEYLAQITNNNLITVQLGNHVDAKALVGSYCCTGVPGQFRWQPGLVAQAVTKGCWLLLEDLDFASVDVVTLLMPLLQDRRLPAASRCHAGHLIAASGFRLFATVRLLAVDSLDGRSQVGRPEITGSFQSIVNFFNTVILGSPKTGDLQKILDARAPALQLFTSKLISLYDDVRRYLCEEAHVKRSVSPRDIVKLAERLSIGFQLERSSHEEPFLDAIDCMLEFLSSKERKLVVCKSVLGPVFQLSANEVEHIVVQRKPNVMHNEKDFVVGRCKLPVRTVGSNRELLELSDCKSKFAMTRVSLNMLERLARCVVCREPALIVGETGTGKTSVVQYLARQTNNHLVVINLNQQSDVVDLVGGFKPVSGEFTVRNFIIDLKKILCVRRMLYDKNRGVLESLWQYFNIGPDRYSKVCSAIAGICADLVDGFSKGIYPFGSSWIAEVRNLQTRTHAVKTQFQNSTRDQLSFVFIEGSLVSAMRQGLWVLLDEINLAETEMLECLSSVLDRGRLVLQEKGEAEPIQCHSNFRLFACMNPATDIGKKDLPVGIRNRFTELYFDEIIDSADLHLVCRSYLDSAAPELVGRCVKLYIKLKELAHIMLLDGTGRKPHYCLRTFCRAMQYANLLIREGQRLSRAVYEGFCLSFLTQMDLLSHDSVHNKIKEAILGAEAASVLGENLRKPICSESSVIQFEGYWVPCGDQELENPLHYILTETVRRNLRDLARAVSARSYPVLIQGETSVGKTSLIMYLAKCTGNRCVRVNNHEHTEISEYVGQYTFETNGNLVFKEGILVEAMRKGYWIILDELNLACSEILEALNRVLDDNRKLFIAETQTEVSAHPKFMLFATQNPPGTYAGRKVLSRAFRNRFIELHFNELPKNELEVILSRRCEIAPSHALKMVQVHKELQLERKASGIFAGKQSFITLRDLFRWAERHRCVQKSGFHDWDQLLADEGFMILAGRVRRPSEERIVIKVLKKIFKRDVSPLKLWTSSETTRTIREKIDSWLNSQEDVNSFRNLVWTQNTQRIAVLTGHALEFGEPVLLVGETGCGKTTVVQFLAHLHSRQLFTVNCHMHSEAADFIGGLRPCRATERVEKSDCKQQNESLSRLFEWNDGPLVKAAREGHFFLADEISLAEDSVLERLNSLLEADRTLYLAEKGEGELIAASPGFRFSATMNPGGDFGKKELSPALRNRFTEIWCPAVLTDQDLQMVVTHSLISSLPNEPDITSKTQWIANGMLRFVRWLEQDEVGKKMVMSLRDILSWSSFISVNLKHLGIGTAFMHGAYMAILDAFGSGMSSTEQGPNVRLFRKRAVEVLLSSVPDANEVLSEVDCMTFALSEHSIAIGPYEVDRETPANSVFSDMSLYSFLAGTTRQNLLRLVRAMTLQKPLLLEGAPGVGKTSIVLALACLCRKQVTRINLSEHTDISDLFGSDLPADGGEAGHFEWRDGPLLNALIKGDWILLDELNLAPQSVLEGLNACLDHRGEIFVPELNRTFFVTPKKTRIFACQNPYQHGGGRKGLPRSLLNRFTHVFMHPFTNEDFEVILQHLFPSLDLTDLRKMITFNSYLREEIQEKGLWGHCGQPWEFNLRDMHRWATLIEKYQVRPWKLVSFVYKDRMRTHSDREKIDDLCLRVFEHNASRAFADVHVTPEHVQIGNIFLPRSSGALFFCKMGKSETSAEVSEGCFLRDYQADVGRLRLLRGQRGVLESVAACLYHNSLCLLVGESGCGKSSVVKSLCQLTGQSLKVFNVTSEMDTIDLLGGFEQVDLRQMLIELLEKLTNVACEALRTTLNKMTARNRFRKILQKIYRLHFIIKNCHIAENQENGIEHFLKQLSSAKKIAQYLEHTPLISNFERLEILARSYLSLSCGGRFTWVDSVLVRALQSGDWLLVENVNFCAASVLDRLNCLLEQEGVLTLSEQGVDSGVLRTIKPHPNFRIIMTMDPRNGELSRAMRNRSHEVFMLPLDETLDVWDFTAILEAKGCFCEETIRACWNIVCQLRNRGIVHGVINKMLQAVEISLAELQRGHQLVATMVKNLRRFLFSLAASCEIESIINETFCHSFKAGRVQHTTLSVANYLNGERLADYYADSSLLEFSKSLKEETTVQDFRERLRFQIFLENISLIDVPAKLFFVHQTTDFVIEIVNLFRSMYPDYPADLCIDHRQNLALANKYHVRNQWANGFVFCVLKEVFYTSYELGVRKSAESATETYWSQSDVQKVALSPLLKVLKTVASMVRNILTRIASLPLNDDQLYQSKRISYSVWRFLEAVHQPVRNVELDIRVIALRVVWMLKRLTLCEIDCIASEVTNLKKLLDSHLPEYFHPLAKLQKAVTENVGVLAIFRCERAAQLYRRVLSFYDHVERHKISITFHYKDGPLETKAYALGLLDNVLRQFSFINVRHVVQSLTLPDGPDFDDLEKNICRMENSLLDLGNKLHSYDANFVLKSDFDYDGVKYRHLLPLNAVMEARRTLVDLQESDNEFTSKWLELSIMSWRSLVELEDCLNWKPPHALFDCTTAFVENAGASFQQSTCSEQMHSGALIFNYPARILCLGSLLDNDTGIENLQIDYSSTKLQELEEIRIILWQSLSTPSINFSNRIFTSMWAIIEKIRPLFNKYSLCFSDVITRSLAALDECHGRLNGEVSQTIGITRLVWQIRAAYLLAHLLAPQGALDPYEKSVFKKDYLETEKSVLLQEILVRRSVNVQKRGLEQLEEHPLYNENEKLIAQIKLKLEKIAKKTAFRPKQSQYPAIVRDVEAFTQNVINPAKFEHMLGQLLNKANATADLQAWLLVQKQFICRARLDFALYRDILHPFLYAICALVNSFEALIKHYETSLGMLCLGELLHFPPSPDDSLPSVCGLLLQSNLDKANSSDKTLSSVWAVKQREAWIQLLEITDGLRISLARPQKMLAKAHSIIKWFCRQYIEYTNSLAELEATKESLYEIRTNDFKGEERDEVLECQALANLFPCFDNVFKDLSKDCDIFSKENREAVLKFDLPSSTDYVKFTDEDLLRIQKVVSVISSLSTSVLQNAQVDEDIVPKEVFSSQMERFHLFETARKNFMSNLDLSIDNCSLASQLLAAKNLSWSISGGFPYTSLSQVAFSSLSNASACSNKKPKMPDFYREANISEIAKCSTIVKDVVKRARKLLYDFEGHYGLIQILKISCRILSLPVTSPLAMLLTGLMRLLTEIEQWNRDVPRQEKMESQRLAIVDLIVEWRSIEVTCWSSMLDAALEKQKLAAAKFSHRLIHVLSAETMVELSSTTHSNASNGMRVAALPNAIYNEVVRSVTETFEASATVGDFAHKLRVLGELAAYFGVQGRPVECHNSRLLKNIHAYYGQFLSPVELKLSSLREELNKEISDAVKIHSYRDKSTLAVKQCTEKIHKKLHKCLRDFEKVLNEPARNYFRLEKELHEVPSSSRSKPRKKKTKKTSLDAQVDFKSYRVRTVRVKELCSEDAVNSNITRYHRLVRKYLEEVSGVSALQSIADILEELSTEIAENLTALGQETQKQIRPNDRQAKRKAKNLLQRKKKSLSELFRQLQNCGLSYRKGLLYYRRVKPTDLLTDLLLDIDEVPGDISCLVCDIKTYYFRCIERYTVLQAAMTTPSKELELYVVERLQGFSGHLFNFIGVVFKKLFDVGQKSRQLRHIIKKLKLVADCDLISEQRNNERRRQTLLSIFARLNLLAHQQLLLIETLPSDNLNVSIKILCSKQCVPETVKSIQDCICCIQNKTFVLNQMASTPLSLHEIENLDECHIYVGKVTDTLISVIEAFEDSHQKNCVTEPFRNALDKIVETSQTLQSLKSSKANNTAFSQILNKKKKRCVAQILHKVECLVKAFKQPFELDEFDKTTDVLNVFTSEVSRLFDNFDIDAVLLAVEKLSACISRVTEDTNSDDLSSYVAFTENYLSYFDYSFKCSIKVTRAVVKLLYIVLSLSVDLTQKGFCLPEEFREELMKEGATQFLDVECGGFGDGTGEEDRSKEIDCEDQLEDTRHQNQQGTDTSEENSEANIKDEKDGIEMSSDFDAKAQGPDEEDVDQRESEGEVDSDDLDNEMGDVEENSFQIDNEMWHKNDDRDTDQDLNSDDEVQGGESLEDKRQIVAKDDRVKEQGHSKDENDDVNQTRDEEKFEPDVNEMNDSYEGETEDPYKSGKEKGLDEDNVVEEFDMPDRAFDEENNNEVDEDQNSERQDSTVVVDDEDRENCSEHGDAEEVETVEEKNEPFGADGEMNDKHEATPCTEQESAEILQTTSDSCKKPSEVDVQQGFAESSEQFQPINSEELTERADCSTFKTDGIGGAENTETGSSIGKKGVSVSDLQDKQHEQPCNRQKTSSKDRKLAFDVDPNQRPYADPVSKHDPFMNRDAKKSNSFEHQHQDVEDTDVEKLAVDAATSEQAHKQDPQLIAANDGKSDEDSGMEDIAADPEEPMDIEKDAGTQDLKAIKNEHFRKFNTHFNKTDTSCKQGETDGVNVVDEEPVDTLRASRGNDPIAVTQLDILSEKPDGVDLTAHSVECHVSCSTQDAQSIWSQAEQRVNPLVQELCEQLRLVLEPTKASKLKGDYRSGKRLNMRKVIDYVASNFRKDKIWMKRTKPNKRYYQIMLAVDDSASMADSKAKEMTFEALALIARSLSLLEAGELGVASYGADVSLLHNLGDPITSDFGAKIVQNLSFVQDKTNVAKLVLFAVQLFESSKIAFSGSVNKRDTAQLLIILSDGRIMSEGTKLVKAAVQKAHECGIFIVYLLLDNPGPGNQGSVLDISRPTFVGNKVTFTRYMESFPFPFYIILRELESMPFVLGEALRQWFELVANN